MNRRYVPLVGVLAVILWVIGVAIADSGRPDDANAAEVKAWFEEDATQFIIGGWLFSLGTVAFVLFLTTVRDALRRAGETASSALAWGAGLATAAFTLLLIAPELAASFLADDSDVTGEAATYQALFVLGDSFVFVTAYLAAAFLGAVAVSALRTRTLPFWLGWISAVFAVGLILPWVGWAFLVWGLPLWTVITSIVLTLRHEGEAVERPATTAA